MKKTITSIFDFLLFSNIFISLCAVAQGAVTFYLIGSKNLPQIAGLLFTSTLGIYNFSILVTKPKAPEKSPYRRIRWFFAHYRLMVTFTIVSLLSLIPLFFLISIESAMLLIFLGIISFFYSIPLFSVAGEKIGIRNFPGLKQFLIVFVWTISCVSVPILEAQHAHVSNITMHQTIILIVERFLFYGAITIAFDVRDLFEDKQMGVKTIPVMLGEKTSLLFCQALLALDFLVLLVLNNYHFKANFWALAFTISFTAWLIFKSKWEKNEYYYFLFLDGVLILQFLALVLSNKFLL